MNRSISVSTDVYAAIWAARKPGEESENEILSRMLGCMGSSAAPQNVAAKAGGGVTDSRNGVVFEEGFVIFRNYKGARYEAVATGGVWVRRDGKGSYPTLNQLNASIARGAENVWNGNWKFHDAQGREMSISVLRR